MIHNTILDIIKSLNLLKNTQICIKVWNISTHTTSYYLMKLNLTISDTLLNYYKLNTYIYIYYEHKLITK